MTKLQLCLLSAWSQLSRAAIQCCRCTRQLSCSPGAQTRDAVDGAARPGTTTGRPAERFLSHGASTRIGGSWAGVATGEPSSAGRAFSSAARAAGPRPAVTARVSGCADRCARSRLAQVRAELPLPAACSASSRVARKGCSSLAESTRSGTPLRSARESRARKAPSSRKPATRPINRRASSASASSSRASSRGAAGGPTCAARLVAAAGSWESSHGDAVERITSASSAERQLDRRRTQSWSAPLPEGRPPASAADTQSCLVGASTAARSRPSGLVVVSSSAATARSYVLSSLAASSARRRVRAGSALDP